MSTTPLVACRAITGIKTLYFSKEIGNNRIAFTAARHFSVAPSRNMKLIQFSYKSNPNEVRAGYVDGDKVVDINKADSTLPVTLLEILKHDGIEKVKQ